jgi:uridine kinase
MKKTLIRHFERYPNMRLADMIKLIYQNEFGGGHIISDEVSNRRRLKQEYEQIKASDAGSIRRLLFESIGGGMERIDIIRAIDSECDYETISRLHIVTADHHKGSGESFKQKLIEFADMCKSGWLPFDHMQVIDYISNYDFDVHAPMGHSEVYRREYLPAYRIIKAAYARYFDLFKIIDVLLKEKDKITVAIDGRCASGKTTLAKMLDTLYDCNIFHTDDYFLRPGQRTPDRLALPGGNIEHERLYKEIISGITNGGEFTYRPFDCRRMVLSDEIKVGPKRLNIVEGAYSMHPEFGDIYDIKVFVDIGIKAQKRRILKRNDPKLHDRFFNEWIPMEEKYIETMGIKGRCDIVFDSIKGCII